LTADDLIRLVEENQEVPVTSPYVEEITARLSWDYSHPSATTHRSKQSVSEMKRQREMADEQSGTDFIRRFHKPILKRPKFMQEVAMNPAERGTAMHMVMQHIDLTKAVNEESI
ncbi:hypothetical protein RYX56_21570, partial [Alkalihalophilus lindianensis]